MWRALAGLVAIAACRDRPIAAPIHYTRPVANLDVVWRGAAADNKLVHGPAVKIGPGEVSWLEAVDTVTHRTLWRVACNDLADGAPCTGKVMRQGDIVVYGGTLAYRALDWSVGLFAVDGKSGRELWRVKTDFEDALSMKLATDREHVYALCWSHLVAFELATGKRVWERRVEPREMSPSHGTQLVAGEGVVAFWDSSKAIHVADPETGADRATIPWDHFVGDMALRDGALYVIPMWGSSAEMVGAFDLATGRTRWRHDEEIVFAVPPMFVDGDAIYFRRATDKLFAGNDRGTEIVALDRATGAVAWRRQLGVVEWLDAVQPATGPATLIAGLDHEQIVLARQDAIAQPRMVTISGRVRLDGLVGEVGNLGVRIGDVRATTDAGGAFIAQVSGLGAVPVVLIDEPRLATTPRAPVVADPAHVSVDRLSDAYRTEIVVHEVSPWPPD